MARKKMMVVDELLSPLGEFPKQLGKAFSPTMGKGRRKRSGLFAPLGEVGRQTGKSLNAYGYRKRRKR